MNYHFKNILRINSKGKIEGPIHQIATAQILVKNGVIPAISGLIDISFQDNPHIHQRDEGNRFESEWTGYSTLGVIVKYKGSMTVLIAVTGGVNLIPVTAWNTSNDIDDIVVNDRYHESDIEHLNMDEIKQLLQELTETDYTPVRK